MPSINQDMSYQSHQVMNGCHIYVHVTINTLLFAGKSCSNKPCDQHLTAENILDNFCRADFGETTIHIRYLFIYLFIAFVYLFIEFESILSTLLKTDTQNLKDFFIIQNLSL